MRPYLYLLYAPDGDLCGLELSHDPGDLVAASRAMSLLRPAADVLRVEIWRDGRLTGSVQRR